MNLLKHLSIIVLSLVLITACTTSKQQKQILFTNHTDDEELFFYWELLLPYQKDDTIDLFRINDTLTLKLYHVPNSMIQKSSYYNTKKNQVIKLMPFEEGDIMPVGKWTRKNINYFVAKHILQVTIYSELNNKRNIILSSENKAEIAELFYKSRDKKNKNVIKIEVIKTDSTYTLK
jgi:hypothetical protein